MSGSLLDELFDAEWRGVPFHIADAREEEEFAPFRGEVTAGKKPLKIKPETVK